MAKKPFNSRDNLQESHLTSNLQYLMRFVKVTSICLADSIGVSAELIGKLKSGALNNPSLKVLIGMARHFNLPIQELIFRDLTVTGLDRQYKPMSYIPVLAWSYLGDWRKEKPINYIATDVIAKDPNIFALQLEHDCGKIQSGSFVFVDTAQEAKNHDYVLVVSNAHKTVYIRRLIIEDQHYLQSVVADITHTTPYNRQEQYIYGVVIGYQRHELFR